MKQWQDLFSNVSDLKQITENTYHQYEHLIKYLDNEYLLNKDISVLAPAYNVREDVEKFDEIYE
jgi:hypothetical protein